ncbi:hypothetical protein Avbf_15114 [Armadillidium vulgare]|nr:hypothetical protein Avbf_15114 [Armadillidium vulgare]
MNQVTYLIPFILLVYGSCEVVSYSQSEPKNEIETCNSTQIMSNRFINKNKIDALLLKSENFTETSRRNTSKNSNETFKRNENLIPSKPEDEEPISFTRSSSSVPLAPTSEEDTTKTKVSTLQKRSITKWKKVTKKKFVSLEEDAETISNIAVTSESTASTSTSPSNTSQGKLTNKSEKATTKIFISSEDGVETTTKISVPSEAGVTYIFSSESTSTSSASPLSTLQEKSTKKRKGITTKVFVSLESGATETTQKLPSESTTSTSTSPSNTSNTDGKSSLVAKMISQAFPTTVGIQTLPTIAKKFIAGSLQQETFEPALCGIGYYGSSCSESCDHCVGKLN